jgi:hypothetical protein
MTVKGILDINFDVQTNIVSFFNKIDLYCFIETCKNFLEIIKGMKEFKYVPYCLMRRTYPYISSIRSIPLIEWAKTHKTFKLNYDSVNFIARNGDLDVLKFIISNYADEIKGSNHINPQVYYEAAQNGFMNIIKWLYKHNYNPDRMTISAAVEYGCIKNVKWLIKHDFELNKHAANMAACNDDVNILKYLLEEEYCEWDEDVYHFAAENGSLNVLKYLFKYAGHDLSMPLWNKTTINCAAENGHLNVIKYLRKKRCPWDTGATDFAAIDSDIYLEKRKTLKWCIDNGCPISENLFNCLKELGLNNYTRTMVNIQ